MKIKIKQLNQANKVFKCAIIFKPFFIRATFRPSSYRIISVFMHQQLSVHVRSSRLDRFIVFFSSLISIVFAKSCPTHRLTRFSSDPNSFVKLTCVNIYYKFGFSLCVQWKQSPSRGTYNFVVDFMITIEKIQRPTQWIIG